MNHRETYGKAVLTKRYTSVNDTTGQAISFADAALISSGVKFVMIHIEGATVVCKIRGSVAHSEDADAILTSDGFDVVLPVGNIPGATLFTVKAPTGTTVNVSVIAIG